LGALQTVGREQSIYLGMIRNYLSFISLHSLKISSVFLKKFLARYYRPYLSSFIRRPGKLVSK